MTYFKIVAGGQAIDAGFTWLKWQERNRMLVACQPEEAQYIMSRDNNTIYRAAWLNPASADAGTFETVEAAIIQKQEYDDLCAVLDDGETPEEPEPVVPEPEPEGEPDQEPPEQEKAMTIQQMREKIAELEQANAMLMDCILEMSEVVYA